MRRLPTQSESAHRHPRVASVATVLGLFVGLSAVSCLAAQEPDSGQDAAAEEENKHEWVELQEIDLAGLENYTAKLLEGRSEQLDGLPDWPLRDMNDSPTSLFNELENAATSSQVIWLLVFADWCKNSKYVAPTVSEVARQYADQGVELILLSEYSDPEAARKFAEDYNLPGKIFYLTRHKEDEDRFLTPFYPFRKSLGDDRKWGTPTHLFIQGYEWRNINFALGELTSDQITAFLDEVLANP